VPFPREKQNKRLKIQVEVSIPMETGELERRPNHSRRIVAATAYTQMPLATSARLPAASGAKRWWGCRSRASTRRSDLPATLMGEQGNELSGPAEVDLGAAGPEPV
jgi:hypothetical protein